MDEMTPQQRIERADVLREFLRTSQGWRIVKGIMQRHQQEAFDRWQQGKELEGDRFVTRAHAAVMSEIEFMLSDADSAKQEVEASERQQAAQTELNAAEMAHRAEMEKLLK